MAASRVYTNYGSITKANIKARGGVATFIVATNANAAVRYIQLHNKATAPAATNVPVISLPIPAAGSVTLTAFEADFPLGIGWAVSTTVDTFTDSATASEHGVSVGYR